MKYFYAVNKHGDIRQGKLGHIAYSQMEAYCVLDMTNHVYSSHRIKGVGICRACQVVKGGDASDDEKDALAKWNKAARAFQEEVGKNLDVSA